MRWSTQSTKFFLWNIFRSLIVGSQEDLTVVTSPLHSTTQILLNNRNNCVKSPIQLNQNSSEKFVKLCDNKKQQNNLNNSVNLPPPPASPRSPRRSTSAALDYQNAVRYLNCQKHPPCNITAREWHKNSPGHLTPILTQKWWWKVVPLTLISSPASPFFRVKLCFETKMTK